MSRVTSHDRRPRAEAFSGYAVRLLFSKSKRGRRKRVQFFQFLVRIPSAAPRNFLPSCEIGGARFRSVEMIRFILLQNRQGKTRLAKYYVPFEESEKHKVEYEVHRLVVNRDPKFTNFVEFRTHKVIYRRYAGLFFSMCVDITDNELAYLECIHLFVEILDHFFSNVCELDLVFNFHKVYLILDEFILAGELQETSKKAIIERMGELEKQE
ncbi:hypothetical protein H6P81_018870 [Aristolochia fimbriata]|nr:hypothetical protein H6P81_018870 [Aristolochia fimbriata]